MASNDNTLAAAARRFVTAFRAKQELEGSWYGEGDRTRDQAFLDALREFHVARANLFDLVEGTER